MKVRLESFRDNLFIMLSKTFLSFGIVIGATFSHLTAANAADLQVYEDLCMRLSRTSTTNAMYHAASSSCIQAAVGHKGLADSAGGSVRQSEQLKQAAYTLFAAQDDRHGGGDQNERLGLIKVAKDVTTSVYSRASGNVKRDAAQMLTFIKSEENL